LDHHRDFGGDWFINAETALGVEALCTHRRHHIWF